MWTTRHIAARTLIWLAAIALPVQSLPAASCGCASGSSCCQNGELSDCRFQDGDTSKHGCCNTASAKGCCSQSSGGQCRCTGAAVCRCGKSSSCKKATACCGAKATKTSCCSTAQHACGESGGQCQCGSFCMCNVGGTPKLPPAEPVSPERSSSDQLIALLTLDVATGDVLAMPPKRPAASTIGEAIAATSLDRCIELSRFTL